MKLLVGTDIGSYTFDPTTGTITLSDVPVISLDQILLITNTTRGIILYNFADSTKTATYSNHTIDLSINTSTYNANDKLQIWVYISGLTIPSTTELIYTEGNLTRIDELYPIGTTLRTDLTYENNKLVGVVKQYISNSSVMGSATLPFTLGA